jgi:hypothetical protein
MAEMERRKQEAQPPAPPPPAPPAPAEPAPPEPAPSTPPPAPIAIAVLQTPPPVAISVVEKPEPAPPPLVKPAKKATTTTAFAAPPAPPGADLPFGHTPSLTFAEPRPQPARPLDPSLGGTVPGGMMSPFAAATPFEKAKPALPQLALQTYASLCAELSVHPERTAEIRQRYGIADDAALRTLHDEWRARFAAAPAQQQEWSGLYAQYVAWLKQQGT